MVDGRECWDEAVLLVERLRPGMKGLPRAELVMAAQYKVEKRVTALEQIGRDVARESGGGGVPAMFSHTLEGGGTRTYTLLPTTGADPPTRFLFNAAGGTVSPQEAAAFAKGNVRAQQGTLNASVDDFGAVADEFLAATSAVSN
jgi:hypothetical protein